MDDIYAKIYVNFKVYPIIMKYDLKNYKEAIRAEDEIRNTIDEEYYVSKNNPIGIIEIGRDIIGYPCTDPIYIVDERIDFEEIL